MNSFGQQTTNTGISADALSAAKSDTEKVNILLILANSYKSESVTKEFYYASEALAVSEKVNWDKGRMYAEQFIGDCYNHVREYRDATVHFNLSIAAARRSKRKDVEEESFGMMAMSYRGLGDMNQLVACQKAALDLAEELGMPDNIYRQMRRYALFLSESGKYRAAVSEARRGILYSEANFIGKDKMGKVAELMNIMAGAYIKINGADSAIYYLRIADGLARQTTNNTSIAYIQSTFCDIYKSIGVFDSAIVYGERTVKMGEALNNLDMQQYYCRMLSQVYEDMHQPQMALYYHKKFDSLIGLVNNAQKLIDSAMQLTKINIELHTERETVEKKLSEKVRHNQQMALIAAVVAMTALIVLTILIYRNLRQKQKANRTISRQAASLQEQNKLIESALKEKEVLLKETHHRVKNNLQLISSLLELQVANVDDEAAKAALLSAQNRVLSIAGVHSKLYGSDEDELVEFSAFTDNLFSRLNSAFGSEKNKIVFHNQVPTTSLPLNTVVLLGLILNELITNSFKHAFANARTGTIRVRLEKDTNIFRLQYQDDGPGLGEGVFDADHGSLGLYLVRRLSKQLKGTASYKFEGGANFTIIFPDAGN